MFTDHAVRLDMDYPIARARFLRLAHGDWLDRPSRDAYTDGLAGEVRVGPFGSVPGMSKLVRVSLLDPVPRDDMVLVPIRWEATGRMGRLFPVLDANLTLGTDSQGRAELRSIATTLAGPAAAAAGPDVPGPVPASQDVPPGMP